MVDDLFGEEADRIGSFPCTIVTSTGDIYLSSPGAQNTKDLTKSRKEDVTMYVEQACKIELRLGYLSLKPDIYPLLCSSNFAVVNPEGAHSFSFLGGGRVWRTNSELRSVGYLLPLFVHSVCFRFNTISPIIGAGGCRRLVNEVFRGRRYAVFMLFLPYHH